MKRFNSFFIIIMHLQKKNGNCLQSSRKQLLQMSGGDAASPAEATRRLPSR